VPAQYAYLLEFKKDGKLQHRIFTNRPALLKVIKSNYGEPPYNGMIDKYPVSRITDAQLSEILDRKDAVITKGDEKAEVFITKISMEG
jgi:hypothetical protein